MAVLRSHILHALNARASYRGESTLVSLGYTLQLNASNSFGPGLSRHVGRVTWTQTLPWDLVFDLVEVLENGPAGETGLFLLAGPLGGAIRSEEENRARDVVTLAGLETRGKDCAT